MDSMDPQDPVNGYHELFSQLDVEQKGYLEIRDIRQFVSDIIGPITYNKSERIVRKIDRNWDGKIDRFEFIYHMMPYDSMVKLSLAPKNDESVMILISDTEDFKENFSGGSGRVARRDNVVDDEKYSENRSRIVTNRQLNNNQTLRILDNQEMIKGLNNYIHTPRGTKQNLIKQENSSLERNNSRKRSQRQHINKIAYSIRKKSEASLSENRRSSRSYNNSHSKSRSKTRSNSKGRNNMRMIMTYRERSQYRKSEISARKEANKFSHTHRVLAKNSSVDSSVSYSDIITRQNGSRTVSKSKSRAPEEKLARHKRYDDVYEIKNNNSKEHNKLKYTKDSFKDLKFKANFNQDKSKEQNEREYIKNNKGVHL